MSLPKQDLLPVGTHGQLPATRDLPGLDPISRHEAFAPFVVSWRGVSFSSNALVLPNVRLGVSGDTLVVRGCCSSAGET